MKAKKVFVGLFVVLALVLGLVLAGCDSGSGTGKVTTGDDGTTDDRPIESYTGIKNNVTYTLETGPAKAKAVHLPGDFYTLAVKKSAEEKESAGTVVSFEANVFTLQPSYKDAPTFTVTISGEKITNISGTITYTDGSTEDGPGAFTTSGGSRGGSSSSGSNTPTPTAPSITTASLPNGVVGTAYSQTLAATGTAPITWSIDSGSLPAGLGLSGAVISGTPTAAGTSSFTVKAENSEGSVTKALSIAIYTPEAAWYGDGSASSFTLTSAEELAWLAQLVITGPGNSFSGKTITLTANLNLSAYSDWTPIGSNPHPFSGTFDGGGKTISNLTITSGSQIGLFGPIDVGGVVKNLVLEDVDITGSYGGGVACDSQGTVSNCHSKGRVEGSGGVGGIVGNILSGGIVENCSFEGSVEGTYPVGGVVGNNGGGTVNNCYSTGSVTGTSNFIGGVVGGNSSYWDDATVSNCYSTSSVTGYGSVGGVVGGNDDGSTVVNCYSTGSVTGVQYVGGVVGGSSGTVKNCVALNPSITRGSGASAQFSRVFGSGLGETLTNNYAWEDMKFYDGAALQADFPSPVYSYLGGYHGADLSGTNAKTQAAWTTAGFTFGPWVWNGAAGLPSLSGVGTVQAWPF